MVLDLTRAGFAFPPGSHRTALAHSYDGVLWSRMANDLEEHLGVAIDADWRRQLSGALVVALATRVEDWPVQFLCDPTHQLHGTARHS